MSVGSFRDSKFNETTNSVNVFCLLNDLHATANRLNIFDGVVLINR